MVFAGTGVGVGVGVGIGGDGAGGAGGGCSAQELNSGNAISIRANKINNVFFFNGFTSINFKIRHCLILLLFVIFLHSIPPC